eukprot:c30527_g1_i1.p1 GENE.c30527_g1_i1~~c30527_g1_i1.p1  ORF type:complete len:318 (+),score=90.12 c30527_g1_i1:29-982(+)
MSTSDQDYSTELEIFSSVVGWTYFAAWSISFYPQVIVNFKLKSVEGLSFDFVFLNLLGFTCYTIYNIVLYCDTCSIEINDIAFSVHAFVLCLVTAVQALSYKRGNNPGLHSWCIVVLILLVLSIIINVILSFVDVDLPSHDVGKDVGNFQWTLFWMGYVKVFISLIKYIPQVILNFQRKSTFGFSIYNILLDLIGGILSFSQQLIDSEKNNSWDSLTGNPVKLALGLQSIFFDLIFIFQHYCLYGHLKPTVVEVGIETNPVSGLTGFLDPKEFDSHRANTSENQRENESTGSSFRAIMNGTKSSNQNNELTSPLLTE